MFLFSFYSETKALLKSSVEKSWKQKASLSFCFLCSRSPSPLQASEKERESPAELTERCFRELLGRAAYGNIKNAVTPVLM